MGNEPLNERQVEILLESVRTKTKYDKFWGRLGVAIGSVGALVVASPIIKLFAEFAGYLSPDDSWLTLCPLVPIGVLALVVGARVGHINSRQVPAHKEDTVD